MIVIVYAAGGLCYKGVDLMNNNYQWKTMIVYQTAFREVSITVSAFAVYAHIFSRK